MKRKIIVQNNTEVIPVDHIAAANGKYLSIEDKILVEDTKLLLNTKAINGIKKQKRISTAEKINSAIIEAEWGQTS